MTLRQRPTVLSTVRTRWPVLLPAGVTAVLIVVTYTLPQKYVHARYDIGNGWAGAAVLAVQALTFAGVGLVILWGHPRHRIGGMFAAVGVIVSSYLVLSRYQYLALERRPDLGLPGGEAAAWLQGWLYVPALAIVVMLLPLLFPDGRVVSRRWRPALWLSAVAGTGMALTDMLRPGRIDDTVVINPTGIPARMHAMLSWTSISLFLVCSVLGLLSLAVRWRAARLRERQQVLVFVLTAALIPVFVAVNGIVNAFHLRHTPAEWLTFATATVAFLGLPVAVGIAIVRHRLYDIDLVVNLTVVYVLLSAALFVVYVGCVVVLQTVIGDSLGGSDLVVVLSTLAVASLFRPARRRIQAAVDRRFFRRRYDAQRTVADFAARARDEVDLDAVTRDLVDTVQATVAPTSVALWLAGEEPGALVLDDPVLALLREADGAVDVEALELDSPAVTAMAAAGVRLLVPLLTQRELVGVLAVGARRSEQEYSATDVRLLEGLATQAAPALKVAQLVREQQAEAVTRQRFEHELEVARLIQQNFLPRALPELDGWQLASYYRPAREVGGDFYDLIPLASGRLGLVIGDVTGKGVPAALVMAATRSVLRSEAHRAPGPGALLRDVNEQLAPDMPTAMFVTCLYGILDPLDGRFRFANAGHDLPYVRTEHGSTELRARGMPLGLMEGMTYEENEVVLTPGETLLLHSDGIVEAHSPLGEMFGFPRLKAAVGQYDAAELIERVLADVRSHTGPDAEQEDDITMVMLAREPLATCQPDPSPLASLATAPLAGAP